MTKYKLKIVENVFRRIFMPNNFNRGGKNRNFYKKNNNFDNQKKSETGLNGDANIFHKLKNWWKRLSSSYRSIIEHTFKYSFYIGYIWAFVVFVNKFVLGDIAATTYQIYVNFLVQGLLIGAVIFAPFFIVVMALALATKLKKKEYHHSFILKSLKHQIYISLLIAAVGMVVLYLDYSNWLALWFSRAHHDAMCVAPIHEYVCLFSSTMGDKLLDAGIKIFAMVLNAQLVIYGIYKGLTPLVNSDDQNYGNFRR
jgi:hypothetical protein